MSDTTIFAACLIFGGGLLLWLDATTWSEWWSIEQRLDREWFEYIRARFR